MRYERKYRIEHWSYDYVLHEVMSNPAGFHYSYPDRWINSIYFDDADFTALNDNLYGISHRIKYRLRWYGKDVQIISNPILEKKIKKNLLGSKEYKRLEEMDWQGGITDIHKLPFIEDLDLYPVVIVRYLRSYFESFDSKIRATIDRNLVYSDVEHLSGPLHFSEDEAIILEIKYEQSMEEEVDSCLQAIPFRMTKNSKFVSGMMSHWL